MGLKARTARSAPVALPKSVQLAGHGPVRWDQVEQLVYAESWRALSVFAKSHTNERFAAFVIDCDSEHGDAQLALDTEQDARRRLSQGGDVPPEHLKWTPISFTYSDFFELNNCQGWDVVLAAVEEGAAKTFVETLCRALVRMQSDGCFDELPKAPDFDVLVLDHKEETWAAQDRLQAFRDLQQ